MSHRLIVEGPVACFRRPEMPMEAVSYDAITPMAARGIFADFREPDILRVAPAPLYNRFEDAFDLAEALKKHG